MRPSEVDVVLSRDFFESAQPNGVVLPLVEVRIRGLRVSLSKITLTMVVGQHHELDAHFIALQLATPTEPRELLAALAGSSHRRCGWRSCATRTPRSVQRTRLIDAGHAEGVAERAVIARANID